MLSWLVETETESTGAVAQTNDFPELGSRENPIPFHYEINEEHGHQFAHMTEIPPLPSNDLLETETELFVYYDLKHATLDDVHVTHKGNSLIISVNRKHSHPKAEHNIIHTNEVVNLDCDSRAIHIPSTVDAKNYKVELADDVLKISFPKIKQSR